ncbi:MAG: hypothetical protein M3066_12250 [Actinomycetota bacterium]|nr:hypothetical protein [Actinomycetota bacterium]
MIETQDRPAAADPNEPDAPARRHGSTISGLGAGSATDARPRHDPVGAHALASPMPWAGSSRRTFAGINLVTAIIMAVSGIAAASGVAGLQAPAAVGRWVGSAFSAPAADVASRPPVTALLPYGKGMWIYEPEKTEGGSVDAIVARAKAVGLTHIYVRTGSSWNGFYAGPFLDRILPAAHAAGLKVYGWDFPRLVNWQDDVHRAKEAIDHRAPGKQRLDGFSADIETSSEGTNLNPDVALAYGKALRDAVGTAFPLIATVPRPSPSRPYPYAQVVASFDAIAPMVYWLNRQPDTDIAGALQDLLPYGKPVFPVGQAYDGAAEGGRPGVPTADELSRFMRVGEADGASGVSFWSWQAADQKEWDAIAGAAQFRSGSPTAPGKVSA